MGRTKDLVIDMEEEALYATKANLNTKQDIKEELVTYEQALSLKQLGFDGNYYYLFDTDKRLIYGDVVFEHNDKYIPAPLKQQAFKFFREKYEISQSVLLSCYLLADSSEYKTHEEAEDACINKLIEIANEKHR